MLWVCNARLFISQTLRAGSRGDSCVLASMGFMDCSNVVVTIDRRKF